MFVEYLFDRKRSDGTTAYQALVLAGVLAVLAALACAPDAHRIQAVNLLGRLSDAQQVLTRGSDNPSEQCDDAQAVSVRLQGEPGLTNLGESWRALRRSADALIAACGQLRLLGLPAADTLPAQQARERWRQGVTRELALACSALHEAATSLGSAPPGCR
jgi:hypothetical protein